MSIFDKKYIENIIYALIWVLIFLIPLITSAGQYETNWSRIYREWIRLLPFLPIFLVNNYLFAPKFLLKKQYLYYFILTALIIIAFSYLGTFNRAIIDEIPDQLMGPRMRERPPGGVPPRPLGLLQHIINNVTISILVVGLNDAIKLSFQRREEESIRQKLEEEKLKTELAFLKYQISPHFFMNTLNNIHALIDIDKKDAKESIIKLSKMMRYLLYDSERGKTTLKKETEFIENYLALMRIRLPKNATLNVELPENAPDIEIPPLLFISIIENAFKHGVSAQRDSFIDVSLSISDQYIHTVIRNSKANSSHATGNAQGIGLQNTRKRLDLLYDKNYEMKISDGEDIFEVNLKIPKI